MLTRFILQQFAAAQRMPLATKHDIDMATARYINFHSKYN